jgi:hypothetical protein
LDIPKLSLSNAFQEPDHHCPLSSYSIGVQAVGNTLPVSGNVSHLPFELGGLKPFTVYTWELINNNNIILTGTTKTLEDGKLRTFDYIIISIAILILCSNI